MNKATHQTIAQWFSKQTVTVPITQIQLHSFVFFYESFEMLEGRPSNFSHLEKSIQGIRFTDISQLNQSNKTNDMISISNARKALFLVQTMTDTEITELLGVFEALQSIKLIDNQQLLWTKKDRYYLTVIKETLLEDNYYIYPLRQKRFVLSANDFKKLTQAHKQSLEQLSLERTLVNPVFVTINSEGGLAID